MPSTHETVEVDFITPRHLAGGGDPAWVTVPLHRASGWSHGHDPLMPRVTLSSPNQKALLRLEPDPDGQWWTLRHAPGPGQPAWYASFGAHTPVELIAAVTDTLTDPAPKGNTPSDPRKPLQQAGWTPALQDNGLVSPDATAYLQRLGTSQEHGAWSVTATLGPDRPVWQARFDEHTPHHLVSAFTTALTDPTPLARTGTRHRLPTRNPKLVTLKSTDVRAALLAYALEERVNSLAARRPGPPTKPRAAHRPPADNGRSR